MQETQGFVEQINQDNQLQDQEKALLEQEKIADEMKTQKDNKPKQDPKLLKIEKKLIEKDWTLKGEVQNKERPKDGLLSVDLDFETIKQLDQAEVNKFKNKQEMVDS
mmetsp:Transcript_46326/g.101129  ORF Transcript_46326/g.101129 Transcript_46326/m.101129 type:complete len:107 (+) Transcript_46326:518-838(+)